MWTSHDLNCDERKALNAFMADAWKYGFKIRYLGGYTIRATTTCSLCHKFKATERIGFTFCMDDSTTHLVNLQRVVLKSKLPCVCLHCKIKLLSKRGC